MSDIDTTDIELELASLNSTNKDILRELERLNKLIKKMDGYLFDIHLSLKHK
jgi:hypothetical protein